MIANYHTHTPRCGHAVGSERAYIETAIGAGFQILGFSDHTPQFYPNGHVSRIRMRPEQAPEYFETLSRLKEEYRDRITLHLGLETEYYPKLFPKLLSFLQELPCEYLIMGQHYSYNETDGTYTGRPTADEGVLQQYVSQVLEGLETGLFTYVAHPDILNWRGPETTYVREMGRLCRGAKELGIPLELNFGGLDAGIHYPNPRFWEIAGQVGNRAVLGCDAHCPEDLNRPDLEQRCLKLAADFGLEVLETVPLRPIKR